MLIQIDRSAPATYRYQVIDQIRKLINNGTLKPGAILPSSRQLAEKLGLSRSTIYEAYGELQALGYLQSRPGSYNIVQQRQKEAEFDPERKSILSWKKAVTANADTIYNICLNYNPEQNMAKDGQQKMINLAGLNPDPRLFPLVELRRSMNQVLSSSGASILGYGAYPGFQPLRKYIAERLRLHGIAVSENEILITNGALHAIDLVLRLFISPKKAVVVEAPTYSGILPLLKFNDVRIFTVPMKSDGMDLDVLAGILTRHSISLVYTMPNFQNPTGITSSHQHRERLLRLCTRYRVPIVEDAFEEDMKYSGRVDLPIKSIDKKNIVIYIGTFSKALFPGLRLGWITADKECIDRLTAIKRFSDINTSNLIQAVMHHFCRNGYYDLHLRRLHRIFRKRMEITLETIASCFPKTVTWTRPLGGYTLWIKMPKQFEEKDFCTLFSRFRVQVSPGMYFFPDARKSEFFRISIAELNESEIKEGIESLGQALQALS